MQALLPQTQSEKEEQQSGRSEAKPEIELRCGELRQQAEKGQPEERTAIVHGDSFKGKAEMANGSRILPGNGMRGNKKLPKQRRYDAEDIRIK